MQPVIPGTGVASLSHKGRLPDPLATRLIGRRPLITFITLGELTKWAEIRHWGTRSRQALADWDIRDGHPSGQRPRGRLLGPPVSRGDAARSAATS